MSRDFVTVFGHQRDGFVRPHRIVSTSESGLSFNADATAKITLLIGEVVADDDREAAA